VLQRAKTFINVILLLVVLAAMLLILLPALYSSRIAAVLSGSMLPEMPIGSLAVIKPVESTDIVLGDIIAFNPPWDETHVLVSHRVIEIVEGETLNFRTKGDANEGPDLDLIPETNVFGRIDYCIPDLGYFLSDVARHTSSEVGFIFLVGLPTVLLIGSAAKDLHLMTNSGRRHVTKRAMLLERRRKRRSR